VAKKKKDELIAALKAGHGIDVEALQAAAAAQADTEARLSAVEAQLQAGAAVGLEGKSLEQSDVVGAIVELANKQIAADKRLAKLEKRHAKRVVQGFIDSGHLLAKARKRAVKVYLSEGRKGLDDLLAPEGEPYIRIQPWDWDEPEHRDFDIDAEIDRLGDVAGSIGGYGRSGSAAGHG
jgi:hypothetical protein